MGWKKILTHYNLHKLYCAGLPPKPSPFALRPPNCLRADVSYFLCCTSLFLVQQRKYWTSACRKPPNWLHSKIFLHFDNQTWSWIHRQCSQQGFTWGAPQPPLFNIGTSEKLKGDKIIRISQCTSLATAGHTATRGKRRRNFPYSTPPPFPFFALVMYACWQKNPDRMPAFYCWKSFPSNNFPFIL